MNEKKYETKNVRKVNKTQDQWKESTETLSSLFRKWQQNGSYLYSSSSPPPARTHFWNDDVKTMTM